jgi:hypothetical protein
MRTEATIWSTCEYEDAYIHTFIHTYIGIYVCIYMHTYIHKYMQRCSVCCRDLARQQCEGVFVRVCVCTYVHMYIYIYIYIYIYTEGEKEKRDLVRLQCMSGALHLLAASRVCVCNACRMAYVRVYPSQSLYMHTHA